MSNISVDGQWKEVNQAFINDNGTWKQVAQMYLLSGGTWVEAVNILRLAYASFSEAVSAPMASPYTADLGSFAVVDIVGNSWYIEGGSLRTAGGGTSTAGQDFYETTPHPVPLGIALGIRAKMKSTYAYVGVGTGGISGAANTYVLGSQIYWGIVLDNGGSSPRNEINIRHRNRTFSITEIETGRFCLIRTSSNSTTTIQFGLRTRANSVTEVEDLEVFQLRAGAFTDEYGIATSRLAGVRAQGDLFTHKTNSLIQFTVTTMGGSGFAEISFREEDEQNKMLVRIASDGTAQLIEVSDGSETIIDTLSPTMFGTGIGGFISCDGGRVWLIGNNGNGAGGLTSAVGTSTASVGLNATQGRLTRLDSGWSISNIVAWPFDVTEYLPFFASGENTPNPPMIIPDTFVNFKSVEIDSPLYIET